MKTKLLTLVLILIVCSIYAQSPEKFSYQAVIRNSANTLLANTNVSMQVSILQGSATGTAVYVEHHTATTNSNGLVSVSIGAGTPVTGLFANISWSSDPYYIKTETDPAGGSNYSITGTSQLMSVPYALYAKNVQNNDDADANPANELQSLSINGNELTISEGNTVTLPSGGSGGDNWGTQVAMTDATLSGSGLGSSPLKIAQQGANSGQVLKWNGTNWLPADDQGSSGSSPTGPAGGDLSGTYPNPQVAANAITSAKIADGTVTTSDMADGAINTPKLTDGSVNSAKIADGAVSTSKIADISITTPKLADASVTSDKIYDGTILANDIAINAITENKINENAVTSSKIADAAINTSEIANNAVTVAKLPAGASATNYLRGDGTWATPSVGGTPGGVSGNIQFNSAGSFLGDNMLSWDNSSKRLGIGIDAPQFPLDLAYIGGGIGIHSKSTAGSSILDIDAGNGEAILRLSKAGTYGWSIWNNPTNNNNNLEFYSHLTGNTRLTIRGNSTSSALIGIGTISPEHNLDIADYAPFLRIKATGTISVLRLDAKNGDGAVQFYKDGAPNWVARSNPGNNDFEIKDQGPQYLNGTTLILKPGTSGMKKAIFNGVVEVNGGKGIIRSIDNIQRKTLSTTVTVNTTIAAGGTTNITFTFPESFTAVPVAYIGNASGGGFAEVVMSLATVTATGGKLFIYNPKSSAQNPNFTVNIVALGQE